MPTNTLVAALGAAALAVSLSACGTNQDTTSDDAESAPSSTSAAPTEEASSISMSDPWVKAAPDGMTAAFGTLVNDSDQDVLVTSATSDITSMMELHETVENDDGAMAMQPKEGGFTIAAGDTHELSPGGDHLMIMDLTKRLSPGEIVTITLAMEDGSTTDIEATVKKFTGADEEYQGNEEEPMDMDSE